jgi:hypothetical protein
MRQRRLTAYFSTPLSSPVYSEHQRVIARHQGYFWPKVVVRERLLSAKSGHRQTAAVGQKQSSRFPSSGTRGNQPNHVEGSTGQR